MVFPLTDTFMEKTPRVFSCGGKQETPARYNAGHLMSAFEGNEEEKAAFGQLCRAAMSIPAGYDVLSQAFSAGYRFAYEAGMDEGGQSGACDAGTKSILLNPRCSFEAQLSTLVHEARHAFQNENGPATSAFYNTADMIKLHRAIEADAAAYEMSFVVQAKEAYPRMYEETAARGFPMLPAYEKALAETGDGRAAMEACFKSWYVCAPYQERYDKWFIDDIRYIAGHGQKRGYDGYFMAETSSEKILNMCRLNGRPYVSPEFLETPQAFSLSDADRETVLKITRSYADSMGRISSDRSVERMFSYDDPTGEKKRAKEAAEQEALRQKRLRDQALLDARRRTAASGMRTKPTVVFMDEPEKKGLFDKLKERLTRLKGGR